MLDVKKTTALEKEGNYRLDAFERERARERRELRPYTSLCVPNLGFDLKWAWRSVFVFQLTTWAFMCMS